MAVILQQSGRHFRGKESNFCFEGIFIGAILSLRKVSLRTVRKSPRRKTLRNVRRLSARYITITRNRRDAKHGNTWHANNRSELVSRAKSNGCLLIRLADGRARYSSRDTWSLWPPKRASTNEILVPTVDFTRLDLTGRRSREFINVHFLFNYRGAVCVARAFRRVETAFRSVSSGLVKLIALKPRGRNSCLTR